MSGVNKQTFILRTPFTKSQALEVISELEISEEEPYAVVVEPWKEKRTALQNRYLWGWLYKNIAQQLEDAGIVVTLDDGREYPYNADLLHDIFKERFLCYDEITFKGRTRKICYSTTELLKKPKDEDDQKRSFGGYVSNIKKFVYQVWGIHVPPTYNEDLRNLESEL